MTRIPPLPARLVPGLALVAALSACSAIRGYPTTDTRELPSAENSTFLITAAEREAVSNRDERNQLIFAKRQQIDLAYQDFEQSLYTEAVKTDLATDWSVLALTSATAVAGGESTKEALGAASAFIVGSKAAFDRRAMFEQTAAVIVAKMRADRARVGVDLYRGMSVELEGYSVDAAAIDLARYFYAGTIPAAIGGLAQTAVTEENTAIEEQREFARVTFQSDRARTCLFEWWKPEGEPVAERSRLMQEWKAETDYADMPFGVLLNSDAGADARVELVNHLVGQGAMDPCPL